MINQQELKLNQIHCHFYQTTSPFKSVAYFGEKILPTGIENSPFVIAAMVGAERRLIAEALARQLSNGRLPLGIHMGAGRDSTNVPNTRFIDRITIPTSNMVRGTELIMHPQEGSEGHIRVMPDRINPNAGTIRFGTVEMGYAGQGMTNNVYNKSPDVLDKLGIKYTTVTDYKGVAGFDVKTEELTRALGIPPNALNAAREAARAEAIQTISALKPPAERTVVHPEGATFERGYGTGEGRYLMVVREGDTAKAIDGLDKALGEKMVAHPERYDVYKFRGPDGKIYAGISPSNIGTTISNGELVEHARGGSVLRGTKVRMADGIGSIPPSAYDMETFKRQMDIKARTPAPATEVAEPGKGKTVPQPGAAATAEGAAEVGKETGKFGRAMRTALGVAGKLLRAVGILGKAVGPIVAGATIIDAENKAKGAVRTGTLTADQANEYNAIVGRNEIIGAISPVPINPTSNAVRDFLVLKNIPEAERKRLMVGHPDSQYDRINDALAALPKDAKLSERVAELRRLNQDKLALQGQGLRTEAAQAEDRINASYRSIVKDESLRGELERVTGVKIDRHERAPGEKEEAKATGGSRRKLTASRASAPPPT